MTLRFGYVQQLTDSANQLQITDVADSATPIPALSTGGIWPVGTRVLYQMIGRQAVVFGIADALQNVIGAAGQPAFGAGASAAGSPYGVPKFFRDAAGMVQLEGVFSLTSSGVTTAFTLPAGYRPAATVGFAVGAGTNLFTHGSLRVGSGGAVTIDVAAAGMASMDGCQFYAVA